MAVAYVSKLFTDFFLKGANATVTSAGRFGAAGTGVDLDVASAHLLFYDSERVRVGACGRDSCGRTGGVSPSLQLMRTLGADPEATVSSRVRAKMPLCRAQPGEAAGAGQGGGRRAGGLWVGRKPHSRAGAGKRFAARRAEFVCRPVCWPRKGVSTPTLFVTVRA